MLYSLKVGAKMQENQLLLTIGSKIKYIMNPSINQNDLINWEYSIKYGFK